jgi:hypothetical protein
MGTPKKITRTHWVVLTCSAVALAAMCAVIVFARGHAGEADPARPGWSASSDDFGHVDPALRSGAHPACGTSDPEKPAQIEMLLEGGELDFGTLRQGVKVEREARFKNAGKGPLCIFDVRTGCGCLKVTHKAGRAHHYQPGEEGVFVLAVDTTGRQGIVRKRVTVLSNDAQRPRVTFPTKMDISAGLVAEPRFLNFGTTARKHAVTKEILLRSPKEDPEWEVTGVRGTRRMQDGEFVAYTFDVERVEDPRYRRYKVRVTHPGFDITATITDGLVITTTHPDRPEITMGSSLNVVPRIMSPTRVVSLGYLRSGAARVPSRLYVLPGAPGITFSLTKVEVLPPDGERPAIGGPGYEASFGKDGRGWWVDVKYDGKTRESGLLEAKLVIHTDDGQQPTLEMPIRATIRAEPPR